MRTHSLATSEIIAIAATRVALGLGVGLLLARKLREHARRRAGWALLGIGVVSTIPLGLRMRRTAIRA